MCLSIKLRMITLLFTYLMNGMYFYWLYYTYEWIFKKKKFFWPHELEFGFCPDSTDLKFRGLDILKLSTASLATVRFTSSYVCFVCCLLQSSSNRLTCRLLAWTLRQIFHQQTQYYTFNLTFLENGSNQEPKRRIAL